MEQKPPFPKGAIQNLIGRAIVLEGDDIDTDRIIPARFLKCVSFENLGSQLFEDDRNELEGRHPFDLKIFQGASILIVNCNFGCGSSREHAPQALMRWGIRGIIGESFAEIFYGNCLALGIPCATAQSNEIKALQNTVKKNASSEWKMDIVNNKFWGDKYELELNIENGPKEMLLTGDWDITTQLVGNEKATTEILNRLPYLNSFD
ncbi:3-isopropylmalate dehydratase small subunit [Prochlorococcus sp. MIT 1300]|uniref:3-isopropylmalate dehydratase small subunit n=1 Tax=Prochlorococcus sp. MIT 1300 TaxID=3096218 RepID=UPI002A759FEA|nr:3-isopropylmalate dehydratase small subunit [Prochlorococcus sp. MIT 1300]